MLLGGKTISHRTNFSSRFTSRAQVCACRHFMAWTLCRLPIQLLASTITLKSLEFKCYMFEFHTKRKKKQTNTKPTNQPTNRPTKPNKTKPNQTKPTQPNPNQPKPSQAKPSQAKPNQTKPNQNKAKQNKTKQNKTKQNNVQSALNLKMDCD